MPQKNLSVSLTLAYAVNQTNLNSVCLPQAPQRTDKCLNEHHLVLLFFAKLKTQEFHYSRQTFRRPHGCHHHPSPARWMVYSFVY